jgi:hypothetical protein
MIEIFDTLHTFWKYLLIPSFIVGIIGFIMIIRARYDDTENKTRTKIIGRWLFAQMFCIALTTLVISETIEFFTRHKLRNFLDNTNILVKVNGVSLDSIESIIVIEDLKTISRKLAHHSSPKGEIYIKLIHGKETVDLRIGQDSEINTEYWVFWDNYNCTKENEVGRINTENLKKIKTFNK